MEEPKFDDISKCPKCRGETTILEAFSDSGCMTEATVQCNNCNYKTAWVHGYFCDDLINKER